MTEVIFRYRDIMGCATDLCITSIEDAQFHYRKMFEVYPTTLFVALNLVEDAYRAMMEPGIQRMVVVPIPGMPLDSWGVCGEQAIIICEGA